MYPSDRTCIVCVRLHISLVAVGPGRVPGLHTEPFTPNLRAMGTTDVCRIKVAMQQNGLHSSSCGCPAAVDLLRSEACL
jgi:hypothetical protein